MRNRIDGFALWEEIQTNRKKKPAKETCNFVLWHWNQRVNVLPLEYISSQQMCNFLWGVERSENIEGDVKKINRAGVLSKFGFESQGGTL